MAGLNIPKPQDAMSDFEKGMLKRRKETSFGGSKYQDTSMQDKVAQIASEDSRLNKMATARGHAHASRRGLLSSSLAAGAAQREVLNQAIPMAQVESQQQHDAMKQRYDQDFRRELQSDDYQDRLALLNAELDSRKELQGLQNQADLDRLQTQLTSQEGISDADRTAMMDRLTLELGNRKELTGMELQGQKDITGMEILGRLDLEQLSGNNRLQLQEMISSTEMAIAQMNLDNDARKTAALMIGNHDTAMASQIQAILSSELAGTDAGNQMIQQILDRREDNLAMIEQLAGFDWEFEAMPSAGPLTPQQQWLQDHQNIDKTPGVDNDWKTTGNVPDAFLKKHKIRFNNGEWQRYLGARRGWQEVNVKWVEDRFNEWNK